MKPHVLTVDVDPQLVIKHIIKIIKYVKSHEQTSK